MKPPECFARNRKSFARSTGLGGGALALGPLGAALARDSGAAPTTEGRQFVLTQADHEHDPIREKSAVYAAFALPQQSQDLSAF